MSVSENITIGSHYRVLKPGKIVPRVFLMQDHWFNNVGFRWVTQHYCKSSRLSLAEFSHFMHIILCFYGFNKVLFCYYFRL